MARQLDTVVALQQALDRLTELDESLAGVPPEMRELHEEYTARKAEIDALEATIQEADAQRRAAEAGAQDCEAKLRHFQEQVNRVRTQREYSAILQEIDTVRDESRALEEQALAAMEQQETAEIELGPLREAFADVDAQYAVEAEKWEQARPGVEQEAESTRTHVAELREALTPGSLAVFERLYERTGGHALAEVIQVDRGITRGPEMWNCAACHYNVRPQSVIESRNHGALVHCDSCKRLLYIEETTA
jgi:predicted  nucleic acid-binding Zn-ribbon protein